MSELCAQFGSAAGFGNTFVFIRPTIVSMIGRVGIGDRNGTSVVLKCSSECNSGDDGFVEFEGLGFGSGSAFCAERGIVDNEDSLYFHIPVFGMDDFGFTVHFLVSGANGKDHSEH